MALGPNGIMGFNSNYLIAVRYLERVIDNRIIVVAKREEWPMSVEKLQNIKQTFSLKLKILLEGKAPALIDSIEVAAELEKKYEKAGWDTCKLQFHNTSKEDEKLIEVKMKTEYKFRPA